MTNILISLIDLLEFLSKTKRHYYFEVNIFLIKFDRLSIQNLSIFIQIYLWVLF
jgi:hypothetical protein